MYVVFAEVIKFLVFTKMVSNAVLGSSVERAVRALISQIKDRAVRGTEVLNVPEAVVGTNPPKVRDVATTNEASFLDPWFCKFCGSTQDALLGSLFSLSSFPP